MAHEPYRLIAPLSALLGLLALSQPLMRSDLEHRAGATTDALTGLANRAALERDAPEMLARARRTGLPVAVLIGDLDHFKAINDRLGHDRGDVVLRDALRRQARRTRSGARRGVAARSRLRRPRAAQASGSVAIPVVEMRVSNACATSGRCCTIPKRCSHAAHARSRFGSSSP